MAGKENLLAYLVGADDRPEQERYRQARDSFWAYCRLMNPAFFREDRPHLRELAETLQALEEGTLQAPDGSVCRRLAISEPPRHGKSYTMTLFNQWCFGRNPQERIINVSYNELLSGRFSKGVRDGIEATKIEPPLPFSLEKGNLFTVFSDIFPGVRVRRGDAAARLWSLEGSYFSFLGAGMGGTITGVGCRKLIIDDPIKNHLEANNDALLAEQWEYYTNTLLSRVEEGGCVVIIMTRWNTRDLVGRVLDAEPGRWYVLNHKACLDESAGTMLCPSLLSFESWKEKKSLTSPDIFEANYQNMPIDAQGRLYEGFSLYEALPEGHAPVVAYVDTADTGADYLCAVAAARLEGEGYVVDVVYSDEAMETTELAVAKMLYDTRAAECYIESNNGGRGFARNVERLLWERYGWRQTTVIWVNQRQNKMARILTESAYIQRHLHMPEAWATRWPDYYNAMRNFQRKGRNAHDDAPDATTGLAEVLQRGAAMRRRFFSGKGGR